MNDLQIEYFIAVARNLSFTKAARELFVSQPAISRQILALEEELGFSLLERNNKTVKLTETGEMFYHFFSEYRTELNNIKLHAQLISEKRQRILRLGVINHWDISSFFVPAMQAFKEMHANVDVQIFCYDVNEMEDALNADSADVMLTIDPAVSKKEGLKKCCLGEIPRVILYPAERKTVPSPVDFKDDTFLVAAKEEQTFYTQDLIRGFCRPYGFAPKILAVNSTDAMMTGILCRMGVAIVDMCSREVKHPSFQWIALNSCHEVNLIWKSRWDDPVVQDFVRCLKDSFGKNQA